MTDGNSPPAGSGGSFELTPGFGHAQKAQFDLLIAEAKTKPEDAERLCRHAVSLAHEFQETDAKFEAMRALANIHMENGWFDDELRVLKEISRALAKTTKQDPYLMHLEKRMGVCCSKLRKTDEAIEHLRAAVLCHQSSDDSDTEEFIDCLCTLAGIYRLKNQHDRARTCIKQAYALVSDDPDRLDLQARVLEELAHVTMAQHKLEEAAEGFVQVLKLKQEAFGTAQHPALADTCISLGMCYLDLKNFEEAETLFVQALDLMRLSAESDRATHATTIEKLAGLYRKQGRFVEASFLEQGASEIVGRAVEQRLGFFKEFDAGLAAQKNSHHDLALNCYRKSLVALELVFEKQGFVRVPILCRMAEIANERGQSRQFKSLSIEIEEALKQLNNIDSDVCQQLLHLAHLFHILRYDAFAGSCYVFAESLQPRKSIDGAQSITIRIN